MADMCYKCQFSDNGYFCRFMEHGVCTAVSCKWMVEFEGRSVLDICKLLSGNTLHSIKGGNQYEREETIDELEEILSYEKPND